MLRQSNVGLALMISAPIFSTAPNVLAFIKPSSIIAEKICHIKLEVVYDYFQGQKFTRESK
jgi:hypothetical protein